MTSTEGMCPGMFATTVFIEGQRSFKKEETTQILTNNGELESIMDHLCYRITCCRKKVNKTYVVIEEIKVSVKYLHSIVKFSTDVYIST